LVAAAFITLGAVITGGIGLDSTLGAFVCGTILASGRLVPVDGAARGRGSGLRLGLITTEASPSRCWWPR
jgi:hypothetical protein